MSRKFWLWFSGIGLVIILGLGSYWVIQGRDSSGSRATIPTFYLPGYGASGRSTDHLIAAAQQQKEATKVYTATISATGHVNLRGHWPAKVKRPLVQVVFKANRNANYQTTSRWMKQLIQAVNRKHAFKRYNVVAHSMGNLTLWTYILRFNQRSTLPHVNRVVDLAGHFNGILGMDDRPNQVKLSKTGRPQPMRASYRRLLPLRQRLALHQIRVLNGYGNLDNGSHSDGRVSNTSSQSLRYLVAKRAKSYREVEFHGAAAQHSRLHDNHQVDRTINQFLWP